MLIRIDPASPLPLAHQIAASVRQAVAGGALDAGDRLPAAREVARLLGVNMHTVLRGYQILRTEGLIDLRRGRGATVTTEAPRPRAILGQVARQLVALARESGLSDAETLELVRSCMAEAPASGTVAEV